MNAELKRQWRQGSIDLEDAANVEKAMEEAERLFQRQKWQQLIEWRELLQYKLDQAGYWQEAINLNRWAIEGARHLERDDLVARYLHDSADVQSRMGHYPEAEELYEQSFRTYEMVVGDRKSATKSLHMLALAKRALGKTDEARSLAEQCLERAEECDMGPWRAHPSHLLGWLARDTGRLERALTHATQALAIHSEHEEHDRIPMLIRSHYDIARILAMKQDFAGARKHLSKAAKLTGEESTYTVEKLSGDMAMREGNTIDAVKHYYLALGRARRGPDERRVAEAYLELARAYWQLGQRTKALLYFRNGVNQLRRLGLLTFARIKAMITDKFKQLQIRFRL